MHSLTPIADLLAAAPDARYRGVTATSQYLTMRDGTQIAIDLMLPADRAADTRLPVIMIMARYWRSMAMRVPDRPNKALIGPREPIVDFLIPRGFAVVVVDARGAGASRGVNRFPWSPEERADYGEVAAWAAGQPWSNGQIGALGISYEGSTAQYLLGAGVPAVKAVAPMEYEFDVYPDVALPGGIFNQAFIRQWNDSNSRLDSNRTSSLFPALARLLVTGVRPVDSDRKSRTLLAQALREHQANTNVYEAISRITYRDDQFGDTGATLDDFSVFSQRAAIEASGGAMFVWGSWLDGTTADTVLRTYNTLGNPQIGVIGAWKHEMTAHGSPYDKPKAKPNPPHVQQWDALAGFFERTLRGNQPPTGKTLLYYTLGEEAWHQTDVFPLPNTQTQAWYFREGNALSPDQPTGDGADTYTVDPEASTGLTNRWHTQMARPLVYADRASHDRRLLTYTSAPLAHDMEITGYPVVTLHIASSEDDGAFFVYLEDVDENGVVRYLTEGQLRGLHRQLSGQPAPYWTGMPYRTFTRADGAPLPRGQFIELTFGLQPTSVLIRRGHRVRVAIAGADKDTFARIPSDAIPTWQVGRGGVYASHIQLPVVHRKGATS
ncbi:MAG: CocE/NonD family hydrolase [Pleurocapsa minor GSE-CHR-MK-17-07R]|jgi:putative CocE/NonD family hydrolase|nr:CocE/NonD family hydrolase [Pleurocapsa minor GSE-CHR-MK 17-07R]